MAAGAHGALPRQARGDQRGLGRVAFAGGGPISRDPDEVAWLKYLADVGRGVDPVPRKRGLQNVQRR
jgi:hypothetical protein